MSRSGNPAGRPPQAEGAKRKVAEWLASLPEEDLAAVLGGLLRSAKEGDRLAARFLLVRIVPLAATAPARRPKRCRRRRASRAVRFSPSDVTASSA